MQEYKKKQLVELVREAKRASKTCASYSKMSKAELYAHAIELELIQGERKIEDQDTVSKKEQIRNLIDRVKEHSFSTPTGQNKAQSFLRRSARALSADGSQLTESVMIKLFKDFKKLLMLP